MAQRGRKPSTIPKAETSQGVFIRDQAIKLFATKGFAAATMDNLCDLTQLNKGTIYYYYKSKGDILFNIADSTIDGALVLTELVDLESPPLALRELIERHVRWLLENALAAKVWHKEREYMSQNLTASQIEQLNAKQRIYNRFLHAILTRGVESGEFREMNVEITSRSVLALVNATMDWTRSGFSADEIARNLSSFVMQGLLPKA